MKSAFVPFGALSLALATLVGCRDRDRSHDLAPAKEAPKDYPALSERLITNPNEQDRAGTTTLTNASWVASAAAVDRLVASRCAREVACSNIGPDKRYVSTEVCAREVRRSSTEDLKPTACPNGIDGKALDECLDAIRHESCSNPIDTVSRLAACLPSDLCLKIEAPHR